LQRFNYIFVPLHMGTSFHSRAALPRDADNQRCKTFKIIIKKQRELRRNAPQRRGLTYRKAVCAVTFPFDTY